MQQVILPMSACQFKINIKRKSTIVCLLWVWNDYDRPKQHFYKHVYFWCNVRYFILGVYKDQLAWSHPQVVIWGTAVFFGIGFIFSVPLWRVFCYYLHTEEWKRVPDCFSHFRWFTLTQCCCCFFLTSLVDVYCDLSPGRLAQPFQLCEGTWKEDLMNQYSLADVMTDK